MREARGAASGRIALTIVGATALLALQACGPAKGGQGAQLSPAQICLQTLDPATGVEACKQALTASPNDPALRQRIALLRLKSGSLAAARQAYQIARSQDPNDAEAQFGYGLTLQTIGQAGGNVDKLAAATRDPTVVDRFRKYGFDEPDLMTYDSEPKVVGGPSDARIAAMTPKGALARGLGIDVKCLVGTTGKVHDCKVITPLPADKAAFGDAAKQIVMLSKVTPARNKGAPVADAPVLLTMVFTKTGA
jgi:tetratricopeptide (TPR) repeat protein